MVNGDDDTIQWVWTLNCVGVILKPFGAIGVNTLLL
jgi:hypothetical protein